MIVCYTIAMAGSKTDNYETKVLNTMRGTSLSAWTPYLALFTTAPTETTGGVEVSLLSYARQAITFGAPADNGVYKEVASTGTILFPSMDGSGESVVAIGYFDALTGGELRYYDDAITPITINASTIIKVSTGGLKIREG